MRRSSVGLRRFRLALAALACLLTAGAGTARAQYPTRPVEIIVPFAAGGGTDLIARLMCEGLSQRLGQSFVAVNRPGANTNVGTLAAIHARPDGHTLLMASIGLAANPSLYTKLGFDPQHDLAPIALIANVPTILVTSNALPVDSLASLIAYVKARPGELNYASYGVGSSPHLAAELFQALTGTKIVHVPYGGGGGPAALGVIGNSVQMLFPSVVTVLGMVQGGSLRAVAIGSERRLPLLPDVPTFRESGVDLLSGTWYGLLAPAGTPAPILARLAAAAQDMLRDSAIHAKLTEQGAEVAGLGPIDFAKFLKDETARLSAVIRNANIQLD
jgi:tripartite-type tricarboxylate transporter receptor subunit TctC